VQVEFLSKISHPNLLQVQGFCDEGTEQILVFDYMPNGPLSSWLRPPREVRTRTTTVLYCTVLYRTVLYCTVLYCIVLYCTVLYCAVLYCTSTYSTACTISTASLVHQQY